MLAVVTMTLSSRDIANYFIIRAHEDGRGESMTNMKVQKLLYYAQSLHLALFSKPLFAEEIQAWQYGPVCPPAYRLYSEFEANQLPVPSKESIKAIPEEVTRLLEETWDYFGKHHAFQLSDMTHAEFPWNKARNGLPACAASNNPIDIKDMLLLGQQKLREIEATHPVYESMLGALLKEATESSEAVVMRSKEEINAWLDSLEV